MDTDKPSNIKKAERASGVEGASGIEGASGVEGAETDPLDEIAKRYEPALSGEQGPKERFKAINELVDLGVRSAMNQMMFTGPDGNAIVGFEGKYLLPEMGGGGRRAKDGEDGTIGGDGIDGEDGGDGAQTACDGTCTSFYS